MARPDPLDSSRGRALRRVGLALLALPTVSIVLVDLALRGREIVAPSRILPYAAGTLLSLFAWAGLLRAASRRRGPVPVLAATLALAFASAAALAQASTFGQFRAYADPFAMGMGVGLLGTVVDPLGEQLPRALRAAMTGAAVAVVWLGLARRLGRPGAYEGRMSLALGVIGLLAQLGVPTVVAWPSQAAPPDALFLGAVGKAMQLGPAPEPVVRERDWSDMQRRAPALPKLSPPADFPRRNVLLVLTESVRADAVCSAPVAECATTPAINALLPNRLPLLQVHAAGTFTAVSFAAITSGLAGHATADAYLRAPLLWDYARAAGRETAYLSAQHSAFAGAGQWLAGAAIDRRVDAEMLDRDAPQIPGADDRMLFRRAKRELAELKPPYFAVLHLASTHYPYVIDPAHQPFQPSTKVSSAATAEPLHNRYRNAVAMQDRALASFLDAFRQTDAGRETIVIFTSDHGESFFEHGVGTHGSTMFETELHVPTWIDAPPGVLRDGERAALTKLRDVPAMNVDLLPTIVDLFGVWNDPALADLRAKQDGRSWLSREALDERTFVTTNCTSIWRCGIQASLAMRGRKKWIERAGVGSCFDLAADPGETKATATEACGDLPARLEAVTKGHAPAR